MAENNISLYYCIDTRVFDRCIAKKDNFIRRYEDISTRYDNIMSKMQWEGRGADAFYNDAATVRTNLRGIGDILANMCNVLEECRTVIEQADKDLGDCNRNPEEG